MRMIGVQPPTFDAFPPLLLPQMLLIWALSGLSLPVLAPRILSLGDLGDFYRIMFKKSTCFYCSFQIASAPFLQLINLLDGAKILRLITKSVYQLSMHQFSFSKRAVLGHIPSMCLNFSLKLMITFVFSRRFSFLIFLILLRAQISVISPSSTMLRFFSFSYSVFFSKR